MTDRPTSSRTSTATRDVLLIDDIHFFQNKPGVQEELFHTFNALYDSERQMVFTLDRHVKELKDFSDRLKSRFDKGLIVDVQPPMYETRVAILKQKLIQTGKNVNVVDEVVDLIANNVSLKRPRSGRLPDQAHRLRRARPQGPYRRHREEPAQGDVQHQQAFGDHRRFDHQDGGRFLQAFALRPQREKAE